MLSKIICLILGHKWYFMGRTGETEYGPDYDPGTEVYACARCGIYSERLKHD